MTLWLLLITQFCRVFFLWLNMSNFASLSLCLSLYANKADITKCQQASRDLFSRKQNSTGIRSTWLSRIFAKQRTVAYVAIELPSPTGCPPDALDYNSISPSQHVCTMPKLIEAQHYGSCSPKCLQVGAGCYRHLSVHVQGCCCLVHSPEIQKLVPP